MLQDFIQSSVESSPQLCNLLNYSADAWKFEDTISGIITLSMLVQKLWLWFIDKHKIVWGIMTQIYFTGKLSFLPSVVH